MTYEANVKGLCQRHGFEYPIRQKDLSIKRIEFRGCLDGAGGTKTLVVEATDSNMNKAGRLLVFSFAWGLRGITITPEVRAVAAEFFTPVLWDNCSEQEFPEVYGFKHGTMVEVVYEETLS